MSFKWSKKTIDKTYGFKLEQFNSENNMFHAIYFIDSISGAVLVSNKYSNMLDTDDDLISGFLVAMNMFIREIGKDKSEEIEEINFRGSRILYERKGRLLCVGVSKKTNLQIERGILHQILDDFYNKFEFQINRFNGVIDPAILDYKKQLKNLNLNNTFKFGMNF